MMEDGKSFLYPTNLISFSKMFEITKKKHKPYTIMLIVISNILEYLQFKQNLLALESHYFSLKNKFTESAQCSYVDTE